MFGSIGNRLNGSWIGFQWQSIPPGCIGLPSSGQCEAAEDSIVECRQETTFHIPECPDIEVSGFCEFPCPEGLTGEEEDPLWLPTCRSVALMEWGWSEDPSKIAKGGFFAVGSMIPGQEDGNRRLDRIPAALAQMIVEPGDAVLAPAGHSPRWGAQTDDRGKPIDPSKWGEIKTDWKALKDAGICQNPQALIYSPYWTGLPVSDLRYSRRPALVACDGTAADLSGADIRLYFNTFKTPEEWAASGARFEDIWPLLQSIDAYDVVCIDKATADRRLEALQDLVAISGNR